MLKRLLTPQTILPLALFALFVLGAYPFLYLLKAIVFPGGADFTLKYFSSVMESKSTYKAIGNTVFISVLAGLFSTLMAVPLSWLFTRSNLPNASKWRSLFCLPYAIPPYIGAMAWIYLANPSNGILNIVLGRGTLNIYSYGGLIWVLSTFFYTFVLLSLLAALDRMDPSLEEAARLSGAGPFQVFFQITLPIIRPSLMSGVLLVIMAAAASFGVPAMIGNPAGIYLVTTKIYTLNRMGSLSGIYKAGGLSIVLMSIAIGGLFLNKFLLNKGHFKTVAGKISRPGLIDLGKWKRPLQIFLTLAFFVLFILPIFGILITALNKVQGKLEWSNLGFQNFYRVFFEVDETPRALWNSFQLAVGAATIATVFGLFLAFIQVKTRIKGRGIIEIIASIPYATPGTVVALAFILAFSSHFLGLNISLYNTLAIIVMAYVAKYLNFALRTTGDGLAQIDDVLAEAARVSGANWWTSMVTVWFPLMKPALVASWFLVFMPTFSELTMTILLTGPGLETLGTLIFQLQEYADASGGGAAVLALFTVAAVGLINAFVKIISKGKYGL